VKRILVLFVCITISVVSFGQDKPAPVPAVSEIPPGPSMKETQAWIKRELPIMGSYSVVHVKNADRSNPLTETYGVENVVLSDCRLSIRWTFSTGEYSRVVYNETVTLKDVDVTKVQAVEVPVHPGYTFSRPSYFVPLTAASDRGEPFTSQTKQAGFPSKDPKPTVQVRVHAGDKEAANRAAEVFRRAAVLCGAPNQPAALSGDELAKVSGRYNEKDKSTDYIELRADGTFVMKHDGENLSGNYKIEGDVLTLIVPGIKDPLKGHLIGNTITNDKGIVGWEKPAESENSQNQTSKPNSPAASRMTNEDVIQLITAGLSEQVIITSIRQAPTKDFDLSPTGLIALKKANVPDAVIVVMQEKGTREQTSSASDTKTPPKYDATLTKQTASPPQDSCSGIESMGIFKNTAIDPAIGGGVVEWLAKIRNNTNVTKIVIFGWIDVYGQQRRAQVQIRGGDIASVRLDLTQARVIPPVRDLRVLSCQ
jgi:hypothetical protein